MNKTKTAILAVFISMVVHSVFFASSPHILLSGMHSAVLETRKMFKLRDVDKTPVNIDLFEEEFTVPAIKMTRKAIPFDVKAIQKMMLEEGPEKDMYLKNKQKEMEKEMLHDIKRKEDIFKPADLLESEAEKSKKEIKPEKRSLEKRLLSEHIIKYPVSSAGTEDMIKSGIDYESGVIEDALGDWQPGEGTAFEAEEDQIASIEGKIRVGDYEDIGKDLDVSLSTYIDPASGEKYFKIMVNTRKGNHLKVIPKEVIYLIDSSKSITGEKFSYIKEGVIDSIKELNPKDRFNLIAFSGDLIKFRKNSVFVTDREIKSAVTFIKGLDAVGQTDVESALQQIIEEPLDTSPSYIILITDGRPTTGVIDSRRIIQEITRSNNMVRPVFSFGGGKRVNKYLLDFISYQNRGWSRFAETTYTIKKEFDLFYDQIKDPVLLNVRYRFSGLDLEEVYPKYLSDFYKQRPFTIYGRFNSEDVFSVQILGEMNGSTKEFIFKASLSNSDTGTEAIAREWAFMKIYYLISRNTMGADDPSSLRAEIERLSRKYNITTPYDIEDGD